LTQFFKRNIFIHLNKFQKSLLYPVLLSSFAGCLLALLSLDYFYFDRSSLIYDFNYKHMKMLLVWFLPLVSFMLAIVGFLVYYISNKIVGPYQRIIRELDNILAGKTSGPLKVRKKDEMFKEVVKRINALIEKIPTP